MTSALAFAFAGAFFLIASVAFSQETIRVETFTESIEISGPSPLFDTISGGDGGIFFVPSGSPRVESLWLGDGRVDDIAAINRLAAIQIGDLETFECSEQSDVIQELLTLCGPSKIVIITIFPYDNAQMMQGLFAITNQSSANLSNRLTVAERATILDAFCAHSMGFGVLQTVARKENSITCRGSNESSEFLRSPSANGLTLGDSAAVMVYVVDNLQVSELTLAAIQNYVPAGVPLTNLAFYPAFESALNEGGDLSDAALHVLNSIQIEFNAQ